jgi:hypothetical protein
MDTTKRCILVQTKHLPLHMFSCSLFHAAYFFWFCLSPMPAPASVYVTGPVYFLFIQF